MYNFYVNHILPNGSVCAFTPKGFTAADVLNEKLEPPPVVVAMVPNPDFQKKPLCSFGRTNHTTRITSKP
jgi:hypothetical protein